MSSDEKQMTTTTTPPRVLTSRLVFAPVRLPWWVHALLAAWVIAFVILAETQPLLYDGLLQEDRFVEWLTVALFGCAAWFALRRAVRRRRVFDGLVGAFCVFVAGEEFSWGQRLLGVTPPDAFLEHNRQQELTVHNFASIFGEPKWMLIIALLGFGVVLPLVARTRRGAALLERIGASAPQTRLAPWFVVAAVLLVWYPHTFTGEWVEALAGAAFLFAFAPSARAVVVSIAIAIGVALLLAFVTGRRAASPAQVACAQAEADALVDDIGRGAAGTGRLIGARGVHKRVFTAIEEGYVDADRLASFRRARCPGDAEARERRRHVVDPWGTAYWLRLDREERRLSFEVYSFGANRRRDPEGGDDVVSHLSVSPLAETPFSGATAGPDSQAPAPEVTPEAPGSSSSQETSTGE